MEEKLVYYLAAVPLLGIAAQFIAYWSRLPSILLLLGFGILLGAFMNPDVLLAEIYHADESHSIAPHLLFPIVSLCVGVILFEGGLSLRLGELKSSGVAVFRLCTLGALVTCVLIGFLAWAILGLRPSIAALLGSVLVVTGPTVVAPMIRYIRPKGRIGSIVKWEGIVIDPIGALLAVLVFECFFVSKSYTFLDSAITLFLSLSIGIGLGLGGGALLIVLLRRYWIPDHLHGVTVLSSAISIFAIANILQHESGLVAVTVMGIFLANQKLVTIEHIVEFKENLGIFLISCLFIVLGSRLDVSELFALGWQGLLFLALLILLVRPASVFISLIRSGTTTSEKAFLSFLAPRGIVAAAVISVFALKIQVFAAEQNAQEELVGAGQVPWGEFAVAAKQLVPIAFLVIVGTVTFYGLAAAPIARRLGLADLNPQGVLFAGAQRWVCDLAKILNEMGFAAAVVDTNYSRIAAAKMDGIPAYCSSVLSDHLDEHLDMSGIGRMLAVTPNDGINAMATREYAHHFGRKNTYQLPPHDANSGIRTAIDARLRGRELFGPEWNEESIFNRYRNGFRFKKTRLSEEFTFDDFVAQNGNDCLVIFVVDQNQDLKISTADSPIVPESGQTLVALVAPATGNGTTGS